jgi:hypothetical protein
LHRDEDGADAEEEKSKKVVEALHKILKLLLRRVKADVEKNLLPSKSRSIFSAVDCTPIQLIIQKKISTFMLA